MIIKTLSILLVTATASLADNVRHLGTSLNEYTKPSIVTLLPAEAHGYEVVFENNQSGSVVDSVVFFLEHENFEVKIRVDSTWDYLCKPKSCPDTITILQYTDGFSAEQSSITVEENARGSIYINYLMG